MCVDRNDPEEKEVLMMDMQRRASWRKSEAGDPGQPLVEDKPLPSPGPERRGRKAVDAGGG